MSNRKRSHQNRNRMYKTMTVTRSVFDDNPTLIIHRYRPPSTYADAISDVLTALRHDVPFNRAVDQVTALDPEHINRDKLAEHTLKTIANQY